MTDTLTTMPEGEYRANAALGNTDTKHFARSPLHGAYALANPTVPTDAMLRGTMLHQAVLEPDRWAKHYVVVDDRERQERIKAIRAEIASWTQKFAGIRGKARAECTAACKALKAEVATIQEDIEAERDDIESAGHRPIKPSDAQLCSDIRAACLAHPTLGAWLTGEHWVEQSMFWQPRPDVPAKGRIDLWVPALELAVDLKFTDDARFFEAKARTFGYAVQHAWYLNGLRTLYERPRFVFVAIETDPPHGILVYEPDASYEAAGWQTCERAMEHYLDWQAAKAAGLPIPGYDIEPVVMSARSWVSP